MDFFDFIGNTLRNTFSYFKSRTKKKYEGDRFEEWVVTNSNIKKNIKQNINQEDNAYWILLEWRSDKYVAGYYPLSNLAPDLLLQSIKDKRIICVECKYRSHMHNFYLEEDQIINLEKFCNDSPYKIDTLYYLFGFEWENDAPKEVYLIPSKAIYSYNKENNTVYFYNKNNQKNIEMYQKYKVILNPSEQKYYIQYNKII